MKYPKRNQYRHANKKMYRVGNWAKNNEALRRRASINRYSWP